MLKIRLSFIGLLVTVAISGFSQKIKIGLKTGQKYTVQYNEKMTDSSKMMGATMETTVESKTTTLYEVSGIEPKAINLVVTIKKIQMNTTAMGQEMNFDSEKDTAGSMDMVSSRVNKPRHITIDHKGIITSQDPDKETGKMQFSLLEHEGDDNKEAIDLFIPAFIGRKLKAGDHFADSNSYKKEKMFFKEEGTYLVKKVEGGIASVSYTGTQLLSLIMDMGGRKMNSSSTGKVSSELKVDITTGMIVEKTTVTESIMNTETEGMKIPITARTVATITISPAN